MLQVHYLMLLLKFCNLESMFFELWATSNALTLKKYPKFVTYFVSKRQSILGHELYSIIYRKGLQFPLGQMDTNEVFGK